MALTYTPTSELGASLPEFKLPSTDGKFYSHADMPIGRPCLIMFICNHCPYVKAVEDRLIELGKTLAKMQIPVFAISSNDASEYPEDSFEELKKRAIQKKYPFPFLYDESQEVAKKFEALCTPDFFLYNSEHRLSYRGRLDDSWKDANRVSSQDLLKAVRLLADKKPIDFKVAPSMGCSIKWRNS